MNQCLVGGGGGSWLCGEISALKLFKRGKWHLAARKRITSSHPPTGKAKWRLATSLQRRNGDFCFHLEQQKAFSLNSPEENVKNNPQSECIISIKPQYFALILYYKIFKTKPRTSWYWLNFPLLPKFPFSHPKPLWSHPNFTKYLTWIRITFPKGFFWGGPVLQMNLRHLLLLLNQHWALPSIFLSLEVALVIFKCSSITRKDRKFPLHPLKAKTCMLFLSPSTHMP